MGRYNLNDRYKELLYNIEGIKESDVLNYARELTRRSQSGWIIPVSTYRRCKDLLLYKESLERNSP